MGGGTLLITEWFLPFIGGSVNYFVNTYTRYPQGTVHVLTGHPDDRARGGASPLPTTRVSLRRFGFLRPESLVMYLRLLIAGDRLLRTGKFGEIHCGHIFPEALVAWILGRLHRLPYVVFAHGEEISIQRRFRPKRWLMPPLYNGAAAVIANSRNTRGLLLEVGVRPERIHVIRPGVDVSRFTPGERPPDGLVRMLSVGRLQARKGHELVLRALARIRDRAPALRYDIAGDGEERERLEALCKELRLADIVRFLGVVGDEELPSVYRSCDFFVLANRHLDDDDLEGFGMVFLEAAACGKPVIGGDSGGTSDAVDHGHNGYLVDTADLDRLGETILRMACDGDLRRSLGARGRSWVERDFQWEDISRRIRGLCGHGR